MTVAAILVAAGAGTRLAADRPKAFVDLCKEPLYVHAARSLSDSAAVGTLIVVVPDGYVDQAHYALREAFGPMPLCVVVGGASRQASVANGLAALPADVDLVLVHDAARSLAPPTLIRAVVAAVRAGHGAVVPGIAVADTVKSVGSADDSGACPVQATVDRGALRLIQTPQGFRRDVLVRAHIAGSERASSETTAAGDDAGLVEAIGEPVWVVPGDPLAFKITTAHDLLLASVFLEHSPASVTAMSEGEAP
jgi:2-C-methyl-D-erythritol 4-phosphate cytidylyltransferase